MHPRSCLLRRNRGPDLAHTAARNRPTRARWLHPPARDERGRDGPHRSAARRHRASRQTLRRRRAREGRDYRAPRGRDHRRVRSPLYDIQHRLSHHVCHRV